MDQLEASVLVEDLVAASDALTAAYNVTSRPADETTTEWRARIEDAKTAYGAAYVAVHTALMGAS